MKGQVLSARTTLIAIVLNESVLKIDPLIKL